MAKEEEDASPCDNAMIFLLPVTSGAAPWLPIQTLLYRNSRRGYRYCEARNIKRESNLKEKWYMKVDSTYSKECESYVRERDEVL